ncbi:iron permease FTR1 family-domain-containing protein [Scenedesmus sp. NREL 46B-D3]|nr:iron permease FTR1 family-domain-containing protein [Scenedesmus sp. NREL 46B-D3]
MVAFHDIFSVVAFFIFLRETLEASVIIAVLLQGIDRTMPRLKRQVWWGALTGIVVSIIAGGVFAAVYYLASSRLFQGNGKLIFQGVISYLACILITYLGFAMMRFGNMEQKYMRKLDGAARQALEKAAANESDSAHHRSHAWSVFILAATAVLREGIESIIFLAGVGSNTSFKAIPLACLAGLIVGLAVGLVIYYGGRSIKDLKVFFVLSTVALFFIAAGQVSLGTQLLSKVGMFGPYAAWADELTWQYKPVADLNGCCSDEFAHGKQFFVLVHAVFGYQSRPTPMILILYCFYWAVVIAFVIIKWRNGSLFDADYKRKRTLLRLTRKAASLKRKLARAQRSVSSLGAKLETDASNAGLQAKLAGAQAKVQLLQQQLAAAEAERDAEQQRLDQEDKQIEDAAIAAAAARKAEQGLPDSAESGDAGSSSSSGDGMAAAVLIDNKDVENGLIQGGVQQDQQRRRGWLSKMRRKQ